MQLRMHKDSSTTVYLTLAWDNMIPKPVLHETLFTSRVLTTNRTLRGRTYAMSFTAWKQRGASVGSWMPSLVLGTERQVVPDTTKRP